MKFSDDQLICHFVGGPVIWLCVFVCGCVCVCVCTCVEDKGGMLLYIIFFQILALYGNLHCSTCSKQVLLVTIF